MFPCTAALFSSAVPLLRLLEANFGTLELRSANENRPPRSNTRKPSLGRFWMVAFGASTETSVQSPTSWLCLIFAYGAPIAPSANKASPKTATAEIARTFTSIHVCLLHFFL